MRSSAEHQEQHPLTNQHDVSGPRQHPTPHKPQHDHQDRAAGVRRARAALPAHFRLSTLAALLAGASLLGAAPLQAADEASVADLQAEVARLKAALQQSQQALEAQKALAAGAANGATPVAGPAANPATAGAAPTPTAAAAGAGPAENASAPAVAEEAQTLDAVVIRSRNRLERLQDVPLSVSVVTGAELSRLGTTDVSQLVARAGNVQWNLGNQRTSSLSIRGIGKQGQTEAQDPAVGLIVDGVSYAYNALSSSYDFTDIDTLEVARGPQGTLLGKNASIGGITVTTKRPSFTPTSDFRLTLGTRDTTKGEFAMGGPVIDDLLAWRGNFSASKGTGDIQNTYNPEVSLYNTDRLTGRVQFLLTPSSAFNARLEVDDTPRAGEYTNSRTVNLPNPSTYINGTAYNVATTGIVKLGRSWFTQQNYSVGANYLYGGVGGNSVDLDSIRPLVTGSRGATAELNWNLGTHTLTSITAYRSYHFDAINDDSNTFDITRNAGGFLNNYTQWSQELRLSSPVGGFVDYQGGLYFMDVHNTNAYRRVFGNDAGAYYASATQYGQLYNGITSATLGNAAQNRYLLLDSLSGLSMNFNSPAGYQDIRNRSEAIFGQANWHLSEPLTVTTGLRLTVEDRKNWGYTNITDNGNGGDLNPVAVNGVALGGFDSNSTTGALLTGNTAAQIALANEVANKYFSVSTYSGLNGAQLQQVAAAKAIRAGQIGVLFNPTDAQPFHKILPAAVLSPTYKFSDTETGYFSIQHGEKSGVAQFTNGISNQVRPERTTAFELGLKSVLLDKTLILDADIYKMNVLDYQQTTSIVDQYTTALLNDGNIHYTTATGNVPEVESKGVEIDAVYGGFKYTNIRFAGAFTDAKYVSFPNAAQPAEAGYSGAPAYVDLSGRQLPGAAKWTYNTGIDYRRPVQAFGAEREFHSSINVAYTSPWNSDPSLSQYAWISSNYITDFAIGVGNPTKNKYDVTLLVKNLFNDRTPLSRTWTSYSPAISRWFGVVFTGKL